MSDINANNYPVIRTRMQELSAYGLLVLAFVLVLAGDLLIGLFFGVLGYITYNWYLGRKLRPHKFLAMGLGALILVEAALIPVTNTRMVNQLCENSGIASSTCDELLVAIKTGDLPTKEQEELLSRWAQVATEPSKDAIRVGATVMREYGLTNPVFSRIRGAARETSWGVSSAWNAVWSEKE